VHANINASRKARQASKFKQWAAHERTGFRNLQRPSPPRRGITYGPNSVPHLYMVRGAGAIQPTTVFNKADSTLKRQVRRKAAKLRMDNDMAPWQKIERIQKSIRGKVSHAGNELSFKKNPNPYTRYNRQRSRESRLADLGDYLRLGKVVCREMAFLTQVALEDAGFKARLVRGDIKKNGKRIGGHAWNEVKIDGKWRMVDTTNPQFNKTDPQKAKTTGTSNGWIWDRTMNRYKISPAPKNWKAPQRR
jgi:hypothetical protein